MRKNEKREFARSAAIICAFVAGAMFAVSGCADSPAKANVEVVKDRQYADIPVPDGFHLDGNRNWAYEKFMDPPVGMRVCEMVYWGDRPLKELTNWYLEQMPLCDWKHETTIEQDGVEITFTKRAEKATIKIERAADSRSHGYVTKLVTCVGAR
ncbi:MAG: hypothetical protein L0Z55_00400 [Planctomycetes bacterium]|nr:hypothetical protein [Planctomycetota bacterium]